MSALKELRARLRIVAGPILIALVASYFAYHVVQGEHGLISYLKLRTQVAEADALAGELTHERAALERRVALLRPDNLDRDMLEESVRRYLHFVHPNEHVILLD